MRILQLPFIFKTASIAYNRNFLVLLACLVFQSTAKAQNLRIEVSAPEIGINEFFYITIVSDGQPIKEYSKFPDIAGLTKAGRSTSTTTTTITGGAESVNQQMVQRYRPTREGSFVLKPFSIRVNGQSVDSEGLTIKVGPKVEIESAEDGETTAESESEEIEEAEERIPKLADVKANEGGAFLYLGTSKKSVYTGEGVHITLYFYLPFHERNLLEFKNFSKQLPELVKKIRQQNVWEEFFEQYEIEPENLEIEGNPYLRFKLYEAVYFPLTAQPMLFPSLGLEMTRYRMLTSRSYDGPARVAEEKTYYSAPLIVEVKELPPHPLREKVAVGNFRLKEGISHSEFKTRKGFNYMLRIEGAGNISSITAPEIAWPEGLTAYQPTINQFTRRSYGRITGAKGFDYFITPEEPGNYDFGKIINWVYFNPVTARYDTLKPDLKIAVTGPSSRNITIATASPDSYYNAIDNASNKLMSMEDFDQIKIYANITLLILLVILLFIYFKK